MSEAFRPSRPGERRGGRQKGTPNRFDKSIKDMVLHALNQVGGFHYLARQAEANPAAFLALVGKVLPLQIAGHDGGRLQVDFRWADDTKVSTSNTNVDTSVVIDGIVANATDEQLTIVWEGESD